MQQVFWERVTLGYFLNPYWTALGGVVFSGLFPCLDSSQARFGPPARQASAYDPAEERDCGNVAMKVIWV
jgi:hypothetical protein